MAKEAFNKKQLFDQNIGLKFKDETNKVNYLEHNFVWG
jgi:hypothetical protein